MHLYEDFFTVSTIRGVSLPYDLLIYCSFAHRKNTVHTTRNTQCKQLLMFSVRLPVMSMLLVGMLWGRHELHSDFLLQKGVTAPITHQPGSGVVSPDH